MNQRELKQKKNKKKKKQKEENYAGPVFQNSPKPSDLPLPKFGRSANSRGGSPQKASHSMTSNHSHLSSYSNAHSMNTRRKSLAQSMSEQETDEDHMFQMEQIQHSPYPPKFQQQFQPMPYQQPYFPYQPQMQGQPLQYLPHQIHPAPYQPNPFYNKEQGSDLDLMSKNLKNILGMGL